MKGKRGNPTFFNGGARRGRRKGMSKLLAEVPGQTEDEMIDAFKIGFAQYCEASDDARSDVVKALSEQLRVRVIPKDGAMLRFLKPTEVYFETDELRELLDGIESAHFVDLNFYGVLLPSATKENLRLFLSSIGVASLPRVLVRSFDGERILERTGFDARVFGSQSLKKTRSVKGQEPERFDVRSIDQIDAVLDRIFELMSEEASVPESIRLSQALWKVLSRVAEANEVVGEGLPFIPGCSPTILSGIHHYQRYGSRDEGFDSPQLRRLRDDAWIFDAGGSPRAPSEGLRRADLAPGYPPAPALARLFRC